MENKETEKVVLQIRLFFEWARSVVELFPALWEAARVFAPLVLDRCPICHKPYTVLWIPVGEHTLCDAVDDPLDTDALYVNDSPLPPF
jgi:hypothetical protein